MFGQKLAFNQHKMFAYFLSSWTLVASCGWDHFSDKQNVYTFLANPLRNLVLLKNSGYFALVFTGIDFTTGHTAKKRREYLFPATVITLKSSSDT